MTDAYPIVDPTSGTSTYNAMRHVIKTAQDAQMTCTICKVMKVTTTGGVEAVGRVNVQPLVQMIDGIQKTTDHATVNNLPYVRMVGGTSAVIIDPVVGDIGIVVSADRDVSGVKKNKKLSPPGSQRRYNISDGIFIGACLTEKPTSYVRFVDGGKKIEISPDGGTTAIWIQRRPDRSREAECAARGDDSRRTIEQSVGGDRRVGVQRLR
jgi:hypothetical protein